jgi:hypothetical protein
MANLWLMQLTETHKYLATLFNTNIKEDQILEWLMARVTMLIPQNGNIERPKNYRPVICLPVCVKAVLLYGWETWLVTSEIRRKIQTFDNRCLRYILRIWWPSIISNKDLWRVTGQADINLEIRKRKCRWIGHTLRKEEGEIPKAALRWNPQVSRKRGRPKNSWRRSVMKEAGRSWNELRFLAADRQKWKELIDNLCS